jgi:hypothetical protein
MNDMELVQEPVYSRPTVLAMVNLSVLLAERDSARSQEFFFHVWRHNMTHGGELSLKLCKSKYKDKQSWLLK